MPITEMQWRFPISNRPKKHGFNSGSISHFTGERNKALFRELIQNSLDAHNGIDAVTVEIALEEVKLDDIGVGLGDALQLCLDSEWNTDEGNEMFKSAIEMLQKDTLPTLIATDLNTKGCPDFPARAGKVSPWEAMVNSEGHSEKTDENALGSFGLGKHAPFAVTPLRCVLYSTCYEDTNGKLDSRFIGRAILVSHRNSKSGDYMEPDGYLGGGEDGFEALSGKQIPDRWKMSSPGTLVAVPGFSSDKEEYDTWADQAFNSIVESFFYAILDDRLEMLLDDETITKSVLLGTSGSKFNIRDDKTQRYIEVAQKSPVIHYISGIGDIRLHIETGGKYKRALALVRHPGLMITDIAGNMGEANPEIPSHWKPFAAVAFIQPRESDTFIKDAEAPSHDKLSSQQVPEKDRKAARKALKDLQDFLYNEIKKVADVSTAKFDKGASELDRFELVIEDKKGAVSRERRISSLKQLKKAPKLRTYHGQTDILDEPRTGDDGNDEFPVSGRGKREQSNNPVNTIEQQAEKKSRPRIETSPIFLPMIKSGQTESHKMSVSVSTEEIRNQNTDIVIAFLCLAEDETYKKIGLMQAKCGDQPLITNRNEISIPNKLVDSQSRLRIDLQTNEPVTDKTFALYCRKESNK